MFGGVYLLRRAVTRMILPTRIGPSSALFSTVVSVQFRPREFDHLGPFFDFAGHKPTEFGGCAVKHSPPEFSQLHVHLGVNECSIDFAVEPVDYFDRRVLGCTDSEPATRLI